MSEIHIVTSGWNCKLKYWNPQTCKQEHQEELSETSQICDILLHPTTKDFYTARQDGTIVRHAQKINEQSKSGILEGHRSGVKCMCNLPSTNRFLSGSFDSTLRLWDNTFDRTLGIIRGHEGWVNDVESLSSDVFYSSSEDRTFREWALSKGKSTRMVKTRYPITSISCFRNHQMVLTGSINVNLWSCKSLEKVMDFPSQHPITCVTHMYPHIFAGDADGTLYHWDIRKRGAIWKSRVHESDITNILSFSDPHQRKEYLLTSSYDGWVYYHDLTRIYDATVKPSSPSSISDPNSFSNRINQELHPCRGLRESNGITSCLIIPSSPLRRKDKRKRVIKEEPLLDLSSLGMMTTTSTTVKLSRTTSQPNPINPRFKLEKGKKKKEEIESSSSSEIQHQPTKSLNSILSELRIEEKIKKEIIPPKKVKLDSSRKLKQLPSKKNEKKKSTTPKKESKLKRISKILKQPKKLFKVRSTSDEEITIDKLVKFYNKESPSSNNGDRLRGPRISASSPSSSYDIKAINVQHSQLEEEEDENEEGYQTEEDEEDEVGVEKEVGNMNIRGPSPQQVLPQNFIAKTSSSNLQQYVFQKNLGTNNPRNLSNTLNENLRRGNHGSAVMGGRSSHIRGPSREAIPPLGQGEERAGSGKKGEGRKMSPLSPFEVEEEIEDSFFMVDRDAILQHDSHRFVQKYIQFRDISNQLREYLRDERYYESVKPMGLHSGEKSDERIKQLQLQHQEEEVPVVDDFNSMFERTEELKNERLDLIRKFRELPGSKHHDRVFQDLFKQIVECRYLKFFAREYVGSQAKKKKRRIKKGKMTFLGKYDESGQRDGMGVEFHLSSGRPGFVGNFSQGIRSGKGTEYNTKGIRLFQGLYKDGVRSGMGICYDDSEVVQGSNSGKEKFRANWRSGKIFKYDISSIDLNDILIPNFESLIADRIHFRDRIGSGSFGDVFRCNFRGKDWAVKILSPPNNPSMRKEYITTVERTIKLCRSLQHKNLLQIVGYSGPPSGSGEQGQSKSMGYLMPLMQKSLLDYIISTSKPTNDDMSSVLFHQLSLPPKPFLFESWNVSISDKLTILYQICDGLNYLHSNHIMHRDIKLENILINITPTLLIKIIDFDFAKIDESSFRKSYDNSRERLGSLHFMAVEVFRRLNYTKECDIFSFGVLAFCVVFECELPYPYCLQKDTFQVTCPKEKCKVMFYDDDDDESSDKSRKREIPRMELINHIVKCDLRPRIPKYVMEKMAQFEEEEKKKEPGSFGQNLGIGNDDDFFNDFGEFEDEEVSGSGIRGKNMKVMEEERRRKMKILCDLIEIMKKCWGKDAKERPKFSVLKQNIREFQRIL